MVDDWVFGENWEGLTARRLLLELQCFFCWNLIEGDEVLSEHLNWPCGWGNNHSAVKEAACPETRSSFLTCTNGKMESL